MGNVDEAMATLVGSLGEASDADRAAIRVQGKVDKTLLIDTLLPKDPGHFSWGGHLGAQMQDPVVEELDSAQTAIVFTNVRSQAEIWYQLLLERRPDWAGLVAVHHGSLDKGVREWVEAGLAKERPDTAQAEALHADFLPLNALFKQLAQHPLTDKGLAAFLAAWIAWPMAGPFLPAASAAAEIDA